MTLCDGRGVVTGPNRNTKSICDQRLLISEFESFGFRSPDARGEKQIAIFTDAAFAEEFGQQSSSADADLVEFATPAALKEFLIFAARTFKHAAIDPNRKTRISRLFLIDEILAQIDDWIDQSAV